MTPRQCLDYAQRAERAAKRASDRVAMLGAMFGCAADVTKRADFELSAAFQVARVWRTVAAMHPQTRARVLREHAIPAHAFAY